MSTALRELGEHVTGPAPAPDCGCYHTSSNDGVVQPVLCQAHRDAHHQMLGGFHWVSVKYQRYFLSEQDARDRARIIRARWPSEAYGTVVNVFPVSRYWLVRADWDGSCE